MHDLQTQLSGVFTGFAPFQQRDVAHIVFEFPRFDPALQDGAVFDPPPTYEATVTVDLGNGVLETYTLSDDILPGYVPEPSPGFLFLVAGLWMRKLPRRGRRG